MRISSSLLHAAMMLALSPVGGGSTLEVPQMNHRFEGPRSRVGKPQPRPESGPKFKNPIPGWMRANVTPGKPLSHARHVKPHMEYLR
jgi:hypothetical protein